MAIDADKIPRYQQHHYDLETLKTMGYSQRIRVVAPFPGRSSPHMALMPRFETPDYTLRLENTAGPVATCVQRLDDIETSLVGYDIRIIIHIITGPEMHPSDYRLGVHLVEIVGHPNPSFTTIDRPLMLRYRRRLKGMTPTQHRLGSGLSRPLVDPYFRRGRFFSEFVEMVDQCNKSKSQT